MPTLYPLTPGTLASNCYPATPQELYNEMFEKGGVSLDIVGVIKSASAPTATNRDKLWIKLDGSNRPVGHFIWQGGLWIWPHDTPASGSERRIWVGTTGALETYDGGATGTVGDASGPMWDVDTAFDGRALIGQGTIPDTSPARTIAVTGTSDSLGGIGNWLKTLLRVELPNFRLKLFGSTEEGEPAANPDGDSVIAQRLNVDSDAQSYDMAEDEVSSDPTIGVTDALGSGQAFVQAPPFYGIYVIKRTARIFRVG